ncbi:MaoC family dehydratase [Pseudomaricurvus alkylphenolicus]|nr:MaoC family dehydratase [Pseudomaricurvus alkylphenolicus]
MLMETRSNMPVDADLPQSLLRMIDQPQYLLEANVRVERSAVRAFAAATENANPMYWDVDQSIAVCGGEPAPTAMLSAWCRPEPWSPSDRQSFKALQLHYDLKESLGYPTAVVVDLESIFLEPVFVGDQLKSRQILRSVSSVKDTRLGRGRFWVIEVEYLNQRDQRVGVERFSCFGYLKGDGL